jgi:SsrA-binding protein
MSKVSIVNKKASFNFHLEQRFTAGIVLTGTEVKSIRANNASISEAYCVFQKGELFILNMHIALWKFGGYSNHDPLRGRKLLLNKRELKKLKVGMETQGNTIVPVKVFLSEKGLVKVDIALAKGKKTVDKREDIKKKDTERELNRKF